LRRLSIFGRFYKARAAPVFHSPFHRVSNPQSQRRLKHLSVETLI
jgi:hypothetical protein